MSHCHFLPNPFTFIIFNHSTIWWYVLFVKAPLNNSSLKNQISRLTGISNSTKKMHQVYYHLFNQGLITDAVGIEC
jgi:predicted secreted protein